MAFFKERKIKTKYTDQLILMTAVLVTSALLKGTTALLPSTVCVAAAVIADFICLKLRRQSFDKDDFSAVYAGLAFALVCPITVPLHHAAFVIAFSVAIAKHAFGGSDNAIFSAPALGAGFLILTSPSSMIFYPKATELLPAFTSYSGEPLRGLENYLKLGNIPPFSISELLTGSFPGPSGAVFILVILVSALCLILRRSISLSVFLSGTLTLAVSAYFYPRAGTGFDSVIYELCSDFFMFGIVFLASDPAILPQTLFGRVVFGTLTGVFTVFYRHFGKTEGSFFFALLFACAVTSGIDKIAQTLSDWLKNYLSSYERLKTQIQKGETPKLSDTQEITLPKKLKFNTPEIDGDIKEIPLDDVKQDTEAGENEN